MIPISLRVRGLTVLKDVQVNFNEIPGDIIAITGKNGQGKTSLLESIFLSMYRTLPSRPSGTYKFFHGRDALVDFKFDWQGKVFQSVVNIDSVYEKMEAFLYDDHMQPVKGITGKTKDFDATIEKIFGPSPLILASSFAAQTKKGSFTSLAKIDRKDLFIKMLDLEILQRISKEAGSELNKCDAELRAKRDELSIIEDRIKNTIVPNVDLLKQQIDMLELDLQAKVDNSKRLIQLVAELTAKMEQIKPAKERKDEASRQVLSFGGMKTKLQERLRKVENILQTEAAVNEAVQNLDSCRAEEHRLRTEVSRLHGIRRDLAQQKETYDKATAQMRQSWLQEQSACKLVQAALETATQDAALIDQVPCHGEGEFSSCQFLVNAIEKKGKMESLEVEVLNRKQAMLKIQDEQSQIPKPNTASLESCDKQILESEDQANKVHANIVGYELLASKASEIAQAKAQIEEIKEQIAAAEKGYGEASLALSKANEECAQLEKSQIQISSARTELKQSENAVIEMTKKKDSLTAQLASADTVMKWITEESQKTYPIQKTIERLEDDRRQWDLLAKAFGPTGIQSLEIDAAGPTVSSLTNDLLFSCFGPRFSIKFVTQELKADGAGYKDEFDVCVIDADNGRDGSIDDLSGGEKVVVGEAVGLAISIFNKMKSGVAWQSLFRDEVSGALDDDAAQKYITMLRRAREIGHFVKVFFIAHQPRLHDLSDARINMVGGNAEIIA